MTHTVEQNSVANDPEGSIFLPRTSFPEREFENWHLQLLLGRGIAKQKDYAEILVLYKELEESRARHIGARAVDGV